MSISLTSPEPQGGKGNPRCEEFKGTHGQLVVSRHRRKRCELL